MRLLGHDNESVALLCLESQFAEPHFRNSQPFRVRYDLVGTDSHIAAGLIYTPERKLYGLVLHDSGVVEGLTGTSPERIETTSCPSPFRLHITRNGRLTCFSKETVPPPNLMSDAWF